MYRRSADSLDCATIVTFHSQLQLHLRTHSMDSLGDAKDVPHVTTQIYLGLIGPMGNATFNDHPISRARPMTLSAGAALYPTCTKSHRIHAPHKQNELMKNLVRYAFLHVGTVDTQFEFNSQPRTLRSIIYNGIVIAEAQTVHGIVQTAPG